ncbi:MAG: hypothetical protein AVDCRST_MAG42-2452, partial [uncultured Chthoniobacterales bacterium]
WIPTPARKKRRSARIARRFSTSRRRRSNGGPDASARRRRKPSWQSGAGSRNPRAGILNSRCSPSSTTRN